MKTFSVFTKQGRVDFQVKDSQAAKAAEIVKNPLADVTEKLREMNDLSNRLTKKELTALGNQVEKITFKDVDGREMVIDKAWSDEAREASAAARHGSGKGVLTPEQLGHLKDIKPGSKEAEAYNSLSGPGKNDYHAARSSGQGHDEAVRFAQASQAPSQGEKPFYTDRPNTHLGSATIGQNQKIPVSSKPDELADYDKLNSSEKKVYLTVRQGLKAGTPGSHEDALAAAAKHTADNNLKNTIMAQNHARLNVPFKHKEAVSSYIKSSKFNADVARHSDDYANEIKHLGYAKGPHPVVRALNEHISTLGPTKKSMDALRDVAGKLKKKK